MSKTHTVDISLPTLFLVLFVGLKLGGVIFWSWWWVLSPLWIPMAIVLLLVFLAGLMYIISEIGK
jgi:hypothetical protein